MARTKHAHSLGPCFLQRKAREAGARGSQRGWDRKYWAAKMLGPQRCWRAGRERSNGVRVRVRLSMCEPIGIVILIYKD